MSGALYPDLFDERSHHPGVQEFTRQYRDAFGRDVSDLEAHAYDAYRMLVDALLASTEGPLRVPEPGEEARDAMTKRLRTMEPTMGLTGLRWWKSNGAPGVHFEVWVVGPSGEVNLAIP